MLAKKLGGRIVGKSPKINGVWMLIDKGEFFIPIAGSIPNLTIIEQSVLWDFIPHINRLSKLRVSRKIANIVSSMFFFLLKVDRKQLPMTREQAERYIEENTSVVDGHEYQIPFRRIFPAVSIAFNKKILDGIYPTYFRDGKLILDGEKLSRRLTQLLQSDVGVISQGEDRKNIFLLTDYFLAIKKMKRPLSDIEINEFLAGSTFLIYNHIYDNKHIKFLPEPTYDNVKIIAEQLPRYFDNGRIILDSVQMKNGLMKFLASDITVGNFYTIENYYAYNYDFEGSVFMGDQFGDWIDVVNNIGNLELENTTQPLNKYPYTMSLLDNWIAWIQNVAGGVREGALMVAYNWMEKHYNSGYETRGVVPDVDKYKINEWYIKDGEWHVDIVNGRGGDERELNILRTENHYAAIIKINNR